MTRRDSFVLGIFLAAVLALLAPVWARPGAVFFNHGDLYTYHVPLRSVTAVALERGRLPFWNPFILLGLPHAANPQAALFYPPGLLTDLFPVARRGADRARRSRLDSLCRAGHICPLH